VIDAALEELRAHAGDVTGCPLPRVRAIQDVVGEWYDVPPAVMRSQSRMREHVTPRHVAMYLARELTKHSTTQLGQCFDRDHGTILHAVRAVSDRMETYAEFAAEVRQLRAQAEERLGSVDMPLFRRMAG